MTCATCKKYQPRNSYCDGWGCKVEADESYPLCYEPKELTISEEHIKQILKNQLAIMNDFYIKDSGKLLRCIKQTEKILENEEPSEDPVGS